MISFDLGGLLIKLLLTPDCSTATYRLLCVLISYIATRAYNTVYIVYITAI
jgi:hypothetical protein